MIKLCHFQKLFYQCLEMLVNSIGTRSDAMFCHAWSSIYSVQKRKNKNGTLSLFFFRSRHWSYYYSHDTVIFAWSIYRTRFPENTCSEYKYRFEDKIHVLYFFRFKENYNNYTYLLIWKHQRHCKKVISINRMKHHMKSNVYYFYLRFNERSFCLSFSDAMAVFG